MAKIAYDRAYMHQMLSRKWRVVLEEINISSGRTYFWNDDINYIVDSNKYNEKLIVETDLTLINSIRNSIEDWDSTYADLQEFNIDLIMIKDKIPLSINMLFTFGCMFTNFLQDIPRLDEGGSSNNLFLLEGDNKCYTRKGIRFLKKYDTIRDGIEDFVNTLKLGLLDNSTFEEVFKVYNFSLTVFRAYFVICMTYLKGGKIFGRNYQMDSIGTCRNYSGFHSNYKKTGVWGEDFTRGERPSGRFKQADREEEEGGG